MVVVLIGPPGCGKGTQGRMLQQLLNIPALSTGDILRAEAEAGTPLGKEVRAVVEAGALVNDDLVNRVVAGRLASPELSRGVVLDGYPRTVAQAQYLDRLLRKLGMPAATILNFEIDEATVFARLTTRRQCPLCGRVYNMVSQPPAHVDYCDDDGMVLISRSDDTPEVIRERMRAYAAQTAAVVRHYRGSIHRIDATRDPEGVLMEIETRLGLLAAA
jgi:adenylate kinase